MDESRRVYSLVVDISSPRSSGVRTLPPPPKSPLHRTPAPGTGTDVARPPTGNSVGRGFMGVDRLTMMRQVNAATATSTTMFAGGEDVSAAVNHRQRIAAEQQRRLEVSLMSREDYTDTPEGQARLQRQQERSHMQEEELLVLRIVEAERQAARALQREKELEEERRIKEQYMAKIRAQREQQEKEAREKEEKRKLEMEKKMKALKEAADAKARAEFVAKQSALEEEARLAREKLSMEVENAQMQVEDEFGRAMQQEVLAEQERQRQIAAEQEEWRAFQEREHEKQREATQLRRAAMAQQYEQDKQRRLQIHKLQKERAAQQAERKTLQNSQQEQILSPENSKADGERALTNAIETKAVALDETKEVSLDDTNQATDSAAELSAEEHNGVDLNEMRSSQKDDMNVKSELASQAAEAEEQPLSCVNPLQDEAIGKDPTTTAAQNVTPTADCLEQENLDPQTGNAPPEASINESKLECALEDPKPVDGDVAETLPDEKQQVEAVKTIWTIAAAQSQGFIPFAQILSVMESSPAMQASLCSGDLLIEFGGIMSSTPKCLIAIAECVQKNVNNVIPVGLLRPVSVSDSVDRFEELRVSLCPQKWKGKGLLGCQLSPFKWPEEAEPPQKPTESDVPVAVVENVSSYSGNDGASALVVYDVVAGSVAEQAGLVNGDILAGCDGIDAEVSVATITAVVTHIKAARAAHVPVHFDIHRWVLEDQCYRPLRITLPAASSGPLGFAMTSFAEYYNYYSSAASACGDCYYTTLTTALHAAALSGHLSCLEALLDAVLKQQNSDDSGYTAGDYLDWRDEDGRTPLFYACYAGQLECVQYLLTAMQSVVDDKHPFTSAGADLYGDTVLHAATTSGNVAVVELLFKSGCVKVDDKNHGRLTAAHVASNADTLIFLGEKAEADLLATDAEERMPLAYACLRNDVDSIQYLCKKHPEFVDYADVRGNTPLHVAAWLGLREASEVLIRFLPSIALHVTNEDGQNPAELARSCQMEDVAVFLEGAMAAAESNSRIAMAIAATYRGLKAEKQTDN